MEDKPKGGPEKRNVVGDKDNVEVTDIDEAAGGSWSGWLSTTFASAKEKSTEMLQYLKQDLSEFGESVQEAGRDLKEKLNLEDTAKTAVTTVGTKMNQVLEQVSTIFGVAPEDDEETAMYVGKSGPVPLSRSDARIYSLAMNENIFLKDPADVDAYEIWMSTFDLEEKSDEMAELLSSNPHLQLQYSQLVPDKASHLVFWHRFYFQVYLISTEEEALAREAALAEELSRRRDSDEESPTGSQIGNDIVNISEEDQRRLLTEYEEEMKKVESAGTFSGYHSRRSSDQTQMSSSSSGSFAFVTHDAATDEVKLE